MKIGTSFSKCLVDIYEGTVEFKDVLVIVTGTDFDPHNDEHWNNIWRGYAPAAGLRHGVWSSYPDCKEEFRRIAISLHDAGVLHQPRQFADGFSPRFRHHWLETIVPMAHDANPTVKKAFEKYQTLAGLTAEPGEKQWI